MVTYQMGAIEMRFAQIIWGCEPVSSAKLVALAAEQLGWKKSTTYTVLRRLCEKGIFQNNSGVVTSLVSQEEFVSVRSEQFVDEEFGGSLPAFLAAFTSRHRLTEEEIAQLRRLIESV